MKQLEYKIGEVNPCIKKCSREKFDGNFVVIADGKQIKLFGKQWKEKYKYATHKDIVEHYKLDNSKIIGAGYYYSGCDEEGYYTVIQKGTYDPCPFDMIPPSLAAKCIKNYLGERIVHWRLKPEQYSKTYKLKDKKTTVAIWEPFSVQMWLHEKGLVPNPEVTEMEKWLAISPKIGGSK